MKRCPKPTANFGPFRTARRYAIHGQGGLHYWRRHGYWRGHRPADRGRRRQGGADGPPTGVARAGGRAVGRPGCGRRRRQCGGCPAGIAEAQQAFGGIDILIANAGGHGIGAALETDDASWDLATHLNLDTAFVCAREILPDLIERKGNIVIVSSIAGLFAGPGVVGYVTMKHALIGLTRSLARDYGRAGVRVNAICPGWVRTTMADEQMELLVHKFGLKGIAEAYAKVTCDVPLGRPAEPEEVASAICFLASGDATMVTGTYFTVDGGASAVDLPTLAFV